MQYDRRAILEVEAPREGINTGERSSFVLISVPSFVITRPAEFVQVDAFENIIKKMELN